MDKKVEKAIRVINEMLIYRGFHITDMPIYNIQANDSGFFHFVLRNAVAIVFIFDHNVSLNDDKSIIMNKVIPLLNFDEFDLILFVFPEIKTKGDTKLELLLKVSNKTYEFWDIDSLQYNPSIHNLVPFHQRLNKDPLSGIQSKYQIKNINQLPWILESDPMARFIGAQENDIVEIRRRSPTSGEHIVYRVCKVG